MTTSATFDLGAYMSNSIRSIMAKAYKSVLSNPREAKFFIPNIDKTPYKDCYNSIIIYTFAIIIL